MSRKKNGRNNGGAKFTLITATSKQRWAAAAMMATSAPKAQVATPAGGEAATLSVPAPAPALAPPSPSDAGRLPEPRSESAQSNPKPLGKLPAVLTDLPGDSTNGGTQEAKEDKNVSTAAVPLNQVSADEIDPQKASESLGPEIYSGDKEKESIRTSAAVIVSGMGQPEEKDEYNEQGDSSAAADQGIVQSESEDDDPDVHSDSVSEPKAVPDHEPSHVDDRIEGNTRLTEAPEPQGEASPLSLYQSEDGFLGTLVDCLNHDKTFAPSKGAMFSKV